MVGEFQLPEIRKRASRHKRLSKPPPMRLTERDAQVVKAVNDYRIIRQTQIQRLFFSSKNTAQYRLWLLWQHRFLKRQFLPVLGGVQTSPILYLLDIRGAELLERDFGYTKETLRYSRTKRPSYRFLEHTLGLSEIRLSVELSCRDASFALEEWRDEKAVKSGYDTIRLGRKYGAVLPDAYFVISVPAGKLHFFLEYDRGPESLTFFKKKISIYWTYFQSGMCKSRYGTNRIRVLTVTEGGPTRSGRQRLTNLQKLTKQIGAHTWFWFTSLEQLVYEDFFTASIWGQTHTVHPGPLTT